MADDPPGRTVDRADTLSRDRGGVFAEKLSVGITALILGFPLAIIIGLLVGRASTQSAVAIEEDSGITQVREAIAPLDFRADRGEPERIEILHPGLDPDGSPADVAAFNLARRLAERGHRPRLVLPGDEHPVRGWRERLAGNPEVGPVARELEGATPAAGGTQLTLNPDDRVIATDWHSAHTADRLCLDLSDNRFTYLIHDYQPFRYPMGSFAALTDASCELPHRAIFLDGLLRDYFSDERLGVFTAGPRPGVGPFPIAMAAAGMSVVSGTFGRKDEAALLAVSPSLIAAEPRLDAITTALGEAERRTGDHAGRIAGSRIDRAPGWDESLDDRTMNTIEGLLG